MVRTLIDFAPTQLALAPRPLEGELTSSWLYRVAAANLVELEELLSDCSTYILKCTAAATSALTTELRRPGVGRWQYGAG